MKGGGPIISRESVGGRFVIGYGDGVGSLDGTLDCSSS